MARIKSAWGIDVSRFAIKCARLEKREESIILTDFVVYQYPQPEGDQQPDMYAQIKGAFENFKSENKAKANTIACSLPSHSTFNRLVKLPAVEEKKIPEIVAYEAKSHIPFPLEEVIWDYQIVSQRWQTGVEKEVIIFAIKRDNVEQLLVSTAKSGLNIDIVQFAPVALYNFIARDISFGETCLALDFGADNTDLIIIDHGKLWVRNVPITGNDLTKAIENKFNVSFKEAERLKVEAPNLPEAPEIYSTLQDVYKDMIGELQRSIGFYKSVAGATKFDKIIFLGNGSKTINFQKFISQSIELQQFNISELNTIEIGENVDEKVLEKYMPTVGGALGLALQGLDEAANKVNLLPPQYVKKKVIRKKAPVVAATVAIFYLLAIMIYLVTNSEIKKLQAGIAQAEETRNKYMYNKTLIDQLVNTAAITYPLENFQHNIVIQRCIVINFLSKLNSILPDNGRKDIPEKEKIWILNMTLDEIDNQPSPPPPKKALTSDKTLKVFMDCAIERRLTIAEGGSFLAKAIIEPLAKEFGFEAKNPIHKGDTSKLAPGIFGGVGLEGQENRYSRFEISGTMKIKSEMLPPAKSK